MQASRRALADKIRKAKGLSTIETRDGKTRDGKWDITAAYAPANQQQSTIKARRTSPGGQKATELVSRIEKIRRSEEKRQQISSGVFPGKTIEQKFEMADKIRSRGNVAPIDSGKSLQTLMQEADRVGAKYAGPTSLEERRTAKKSADRIMEESGAREAVDRAMGVRSVRPASRAEIENAPLRLSNERSSGQGRKRGRSVD